MKYFILSFFVFLSSSSVSFAKAKNNSEVIYNEITQVSTKWTVTETNDRIKFNLTLNFNGNKSGYAGDLQGSASLLYKKKKITLTLQLKLTKTIFHMLGKYPAVTTVFSGTITSSDPQVFPVEHKILKKETMVFKINKLCPKNRRMMQKCMIPSK